MRGVCLRVEGAGGFGSSDWLIRTLLAVSLACTLYDRQAICQTAGADLIVGAFRQAISPGGLTPQA